LIVPAAGVLPSRGNPTEYSTRSENVRASAIRHCEGSTLAAVGSRGVVVVVVGAAVVVAATVVVGTAVVVGAAVVVAATVVVGTAVVVGAAVVVAATVVVGTAVVVGAGVAAGATVVTGVAVSELPPHPEATNKNVRTTACFLTVSVCHPSPEGGVSLTP